MQQQNDEIFSSEIPGLMFGLSPLVISIFSIRKSRRSSKNRFPGS
jgi:hypothetical protein